MTWEEYEQRVLSEWRVLINSDECSEKLVHQFLVRHPSMVPGAHSMAGPSGHSPIHRAILSESPLSGIGRRIPDFIWLAKDSLNFTPVFIEIENPRKKWFTKREEPTHDLSQALNQLGQWQTWLKQPENLLIFYRVFDIPDDMRRHLNFRPQFVLIYGRRKEFERRPHLNPLRAQFEKDGQVVMTFDRLKPNRDCCNYLSVTRQGTQGFIAEAVPATMALGPIEAPSFSRISNIPKAIQQNNWISPDRRRFLIERLSYWNKWARGETPGPVSGELE